MAVLLQHLKLIQQGKISTPRAYAFADGVLTPTESTDPAAYDQVIDGHGYLASSSWIDLRCGLGEPGQEYRETIASLCASLQASGFAKAVVTPSTPEGMVVGLTATLPA